MNDAVLSDPVHVFIALALVVCGSLWALSRPQLAAIANVFPAPIWIYALPVALSGAGLIPYESPAYSTMSAVLVPITLFLLTVSSDFTSTFRIGHLAILVLASATAGILAGGFLSYFVLLPYLPEESWKGFAVFAASWIGGSANMVATQQGLDAAPSVLGPLLIVDSVLGYGWVAFLLFLSGHQKLMERLFRKSAGQSHDVSNVIVQDVEKKPVSREGLARVLCVALFFSAISLMVSHVLPELGDPTIVTQTTWSILLIVAIGVACSFTPLQKLEADGASDIGFVLILTLLASLGARADFGAFLDAPVYFIAGLIWLFVHLLCLTIAARILRSPPVLFASASAANIGGFVTAPIVAAAYNKSLVPTALLMAAITQIAGIYLPFALASLLAGL